MKVGCKFVHCKIPLKDSQVSLETLRWLYLTPLSLINFRMLNTHIQKLASGIRRCFPQDGKLQVRAQDTIRLLKRNII